MGTRLYPMTKDPRSLEKLAGVPKGTYARLRKLEALREEAEQSGLPVLATMPDGSVMSKAWDRDRVYHRFLDILRSDKEADKLHGFLTFGWGKFDFPEGFPVQSDSLDEAGECGWACVGGTRSESLCRELLQWNFLDESVSLRLAKGLCWS